MQQKTPSGDEVRLVLQSVFASQAFTNSARLQEFLSYIVEEKLAGRGSTITGKTVAVAVYEREIDEAGSAQNLVRVEARRLRRALDEYYATEGRSEGLRICVKTGSYTPSFNFVAQNEEAEAAEAPQPEGKSETAILRHPQVPRLFVVIACGLTGVLIALVAATDLRDASIAPQGSDIHKNNPELAALKERSVASVQSYNIAEQARGMFFPLFDAKRQEIALNSFRHAISLDPDLPSGYAGAAQVLALLSFLSPDTDTSSDLLLQAKDMAARGLKHGPTAGWAQAAQAWTLAVEGNVNEALTRARIAFELSPEDGHVLDLIGLTALVAGDASLIAKVSDPARFRSGVGRFGANSLWGTSQLMLQNYGATIEAFTMAAKRGLPISAASLLLLATAHNASGNEIAAEKTIREMKNTWPEFPAEAVATRFFERDQETLKRVLRTLRVSPSQD